MLATSDLPGGVVNVLTGHTAELAPTLADHLDVNALDLTGADFDAELTTDLVVRASENTKRVFVPRGGEPDWTRPPGGPHPILRWCETKTVWHPVGT
ncbi:MAG: aldehyde dehydrogenase family protein [Acidimicrobiales bacterium]